MNDSQLSALIGLAGSLVGALAALAGTWISNRHTAQVAEVQRREEQREKYGEELKAAYVDWMHAAHHAVQRMLVVHNAVLDGRRDLPEEVWDEMRNDVILGGAKLRIIDDSQATVDLVEKFFRTYFASLQTIANGSKTLDERNEARLAIAIHLGEVGKALRERFALPTGAITKRP